MDYEHSPEINADCSINLAHDVAASPFFPFPLDITTLNPAFIDCSIDFSGVWDPPHTLIKESAMLPNSFSSDPPPSSRAAPGVQVTPKLAPATTTVSTNGPSQMPLADPKESSTASTIDKLGDPGKSMDHSEQPTKIGIPPDTVALPFSSPETKATPAAAPVAGAFASQPSNDKSWQLSDPIKTQPIAVAETSGPAILIALPKADDPNDPNKEGAPRGKLSLRPMPPPQAMMPAVLRRWIIYLL